MRVRRVKPKRKNKPAGDRRERFAREYARDHNATQAAIRAGYAKKTARQQGSRLLTDADIVAKADAIRAETAARTGLTVERICREIELVAFGDRRKLFDPEGRLRPMHLMEEDTAALVDTIDMDSSTIERERKDGSTVRTIDLKQRVRTWSKLKALDQGMAFLGMHKSRAAGEEGGGLTINITPFRGKAGAK